MKTLMLRSALVLAAATGTGHAASLPTWEGWIVGAPCADAKRITD